MLTTKLLKIFNSPKCVVLKSRTYKNRIYELKKKENKDLFEK